MSEGVDLYDRDFVAWTEQQARHIRAALTVHSNLAVDWVNVAEEIEDLGKSVRHELVSRLTTIVEHLLKLQHSPATDPRPGWAATVVRSRLEARDLLEDSPSLRSQLDRLVQRANRNAAKIVQVELGRRGEAGSGSDGSFAPREFTVEEVLGDWFPAVDTYTTA